MVHCRKLLVILTFTIVMAFSVATPSSVWADVRQETLDGR